MKSGYSVFPQSCPKFIIKVEVSNENDIFQIAKNQCGMGFGPF
jgi:hypothetical protein